MLEAEWTQLLDKLDKTSRQRQALLLSCRYCVRAKLRRKKTSTPMAGLDFGSSRILAENLSDVLLHINMRDSSNVLQQEAIGIL